MTNAPPGTPPPWRPRGYTPGAHGSDAPTDAVDVDRTVIQPAPPPPPPAPPGPPVRMGLPGMPHPPAYGRPRRRNPLTIPLAVCASIAAGILVAAVLLAIARSVQSARTATTVPGGDVAPTTRPSTTRPGPPEGSSAERPAPVGVALSPAKNWKLTVTAADLDGSIRIGGRVPVKPGKGNVHVIVSMSATNERAEPANLSEMKVSLLTPDGVAHSPSLLPTSRPINPLSQVQPGGTVSGDVAFEVSSEAASGAVLVAEPQFTLDRDEDQRFFALQ